MIGNLIRDWHRAYLRWQLRFVYWRHQHRTQRARRRNQQNLAALGTIPPSVKRDILIGKYDDRHKAPTGH
jgi:hypothetical protein